MENLLNQKLNIYETQKVIKTIEESYKRETIAKMRYVMNDLKTDFRALMNIFFMENEYVKYDCEKLTYVFMKQKINEDDEDDGYADNWTLTTGYAINNWNNPYEWRDNVFDDMIRWRAHKNAMLEYVNIYLQSTKYCRMYLIHHMDE